MIIKCDVPAQRLSLRPAKINSLLAKVRSVRRQKMNNCEQGTLLKRDRVAFAKQRAPAAALAADLSECLISL